MDNNTFGNITPDSTDQTPQPMPTPAPAPTVDQAQIYPTPDANAPAQDVPTTVGDKNPDIKNYDKIDGWLGVYVIASVLYVVNAVRSFKGSPTTQQCNAFDSFKSGMCADFNSFVTMSNAFLGVLVVANVAVIALIAMRKKIGITVAIVTEMFNALAVLILTFISKGLLEPFNEYAILQPEVSSTMTSLYINLGLTIVSSVVWITYFLKSERVKKTLTK